MTGPRLARIAQPAALVVAACTGKETSPAGVDLLPGDVLGRPQTAVSTAFSRVADFAVFPADRADAERLATAHDWPTPDGFESRALFRFAIADLDSLPEGTEFSAPTVRLVFISPAVDVTLRLHRVTSAWSEEAATWTQREFGVPWAAPGGDFDPMPVARFTLAAAPPDTTPGDTTAAQPDSIEVGIPLELLAGWRSGAVPNHGLVLVQETPGQVVDFSSADDPLVGTNPNGPTLRVEALLPDKDTAALIGVLAQDDVFIALDESPFPPDGFVVRGAEPPHRAVLRPTLEDVPAGATIASVQLVLTIRAVGIPRDSLTLLAVGLVTEFRGENTVFQPTTLFSLPLGVATIRPAAQPGDTVVLESELLTRRVRRWLADPASNTGVGLRLAEFGTTSESLFFGGVQFHGREAPAAERPRLRILFVPSALPQGPGS